MTDMPRFYIPYATLFHIRSDIVCHTSFISTRFDL